MFRLIFLYEGKIVWEGMTHEFTSSANPIVKQVIIIASLSNLWFHSVSYLVHCCIWRFTPYKLLYNIGASVKYLVICKVHVKMRD